MKPTFVNVNYMKYSLFQAIHLLMQFSNVFPDAKTILRKRKIEDIIYKQGNNFFSYKICLPKVS
jgi:hypothetical protein